MDTIAAMSVRPTVLFVCVHNAGRSQMAAALTATLGGDRVTVRSAGSDPADAISPAAVEAMAELGVDIHDELPKLLHIDAVRAADVVITMGCGDSCPIFPGKRYEDWNVGDPYGQDVAAVTEIRNEIEVHVRQLLSELMPDLTVPAAGAPTSQEH